MKLTKNIKIKAEVINDDCVQISIFDEDKMISLEVKSISDFDYSLTTDNNRVHLQCIYKSFIYKLIEDLDKEKKQYKQKLEQIRKDFEKEFIIPDICTYYEGKYILNESRVFNNNNTYMYPFYRDSIINYNEKWEVWQRAKGV